MQVHQEGLTVLLSGADGVVNRLHLKSTVDTVNQYSVNMKVLARVLYIMPLTKVVHLTLQSSVCSERLVFYHLLLGFRLLLKNYFIANSDVSKKNFMYDRLWIHLWMDLNKVSEL